MWLIEPSTFSPSAPAAEDSTAGPNLLCKALATRLASSAALSGTLSPAKSWRGRWKRAEWLRSLCGRICEPSTAAHGVESWISSLQASRAKAIALPESDCLPTTNAICGRTRLESFGSFPKVESASVSSSKTSSALWSPIGKEIAKPRYDGCSATWPRWGGMRNGVCFRRPPLVPVTGASGCSSWPTPDSNAMNDGQDPAENQARRERLKAKHGNGNGAGLTLGGAVAMWPTARAEDSESAGNHPGATDSLTGATSQWATPQAHDAGGGRSKKNWNDPRHGARCLVNEASNWPTPNATDDRNTSGGRGKETNPTLRIRVEQQWQTPEQACSLSSLLGPPIPDGPTSSATRRRLNPQFVSWLMGWPVLAESGFAFSETEWSTYKRRQLSALSSVRLVEAGESGLFDAGGAA